MTEFLVSHMVLHRQVLFLFLFKTSQSHHLQKSINIPKAYIFLKIKVSHNFRKIHHNNATTITSF